MLAESNTLYSHLLKSTATPSLKAIKEIAERLLSMYAANNIDNSYWEIHLLKEFQTELERRRCVAYYILKKIAKDLLQFESVVINDFDCDQGLFSLCFVEILQKFKKAPKVTINLVSADSNALSRAILHYAIIFPSVKVSAINVSPAKIKNEVACSSALTINFFHNKLSSYDDPVAVYSNIYKHSHFLYNFSIFVEDCAGNTFYPKVADVAFNNLVTLYSKYCYKNEVAKTCTLTPKKGEHQNSYCIRYAIISCLSIRNLKLVTPIDSSFRFLCPGQYWQKMFNVPLCVYAFERPLRHTTWTNCLATMGNIVPNSLNLTGESDELVDNGNLDTPSVKVCAENFMLLDIAKALTCHLKYGKKILDVYINAGEAGITECFNNVGLLYLYGGESVFGPNAIKVGMRYITKAAVNGSNCAYFNLASYYCEKKDYDNAIKYYKLSASLGNRDASYNLAIIYHFGHLGQDVDIPYAKAKYLECINFDQKNESASVACENNVNHAVLNLLLLNRDSDLTYLSRIYSHANRPSDEVQYAFTALSLMAKGWSNDFANIMKLHATDERTSTIEKYNYLIALYRGLNYKSIQLEKNRDTAIQEMQSLLLENSNVWPEQRQFILPTLASWFADNGDNAQSTHYWKQAAEINSDRRCAYLTNAEQINKRDQSVWERFAVGEGCTSCHECSNYNVHERCCPKAQMNVAKTLPIESGLQLIKKAAAQEYARACYQLTVQTAIDNLDIKELSNEEQLQFSSGIRLPELYLPLIETLSDADSVNNIRIAAEAGLKKAIVFAKEIAKFNNNVWEYYYWTAICGDCREMYHAMSNMTGLTEHSNGCSQKYILSDFTALMIRKAKDYISNSPADAHFACFAAYFCSRNGLDDAALDLCYLAKEHGMPMDTLIHSICNSRDDWYNDNSDKNDYRQDSWDAMTDGMYGDYPGSGTDYDGIGF